MSCFNNSQFDRIRARQVDEYTDPPTRRLSAYDREQLENMGLDESDILEDILDEVEEE